LPSSDSRPSIPSVKLLDFALAKRDSMNRVNIFAIGAGRVLQDDRNV